jgi:Ala-tRNA(Pro) deacylase
MAIHQQKPDPKIMQKLEDLNIDFETFNHAPFFTCADSSDLYTEHIKDNLVANSKTLILRNKKKTNYYMVITDCNKKIKIKSLQERINSGRLSFVSPNDLESILEVYPGCVNPFSLIHDQDNKIDLIIDEESLHFQHQTFHPSNNEYTIKLSTDSFLKYLGALGVKTNIINFA